MKRLLLCLLALLLPLSALAEEPAQPFDPALTGSLTVKSYTVTAQHTFLLLELPQGSLRLRIAQRETPQAEWIIQDNDTLPADASFGGADDSQLTLYWSAGDGSHQHEHQAQALFVRDMQGKWRLKYFQCQGQSYGAGWNWLADSEHRWLYEDVTPASPCYYGDHPLADIAGIDFTRFPMTLEQALAQLDQSAWAVVSNPDPADRLHLRAKASRSGKSLGKFYNGTPVQVLSVKGDWARVSIGSTGLEGYMMTRYLARTPAAMNSVARVVPEDGLCPRYEDSAIPVYATPDIADLSWTTEPYDYNLLVIGVYEDDYYVVMDPDGRTGYVLQELLFAGNG